MTPQHKEWKTFLTSFKKQKWNSKALNMTGKELSKGVVKLKKRIMRTDKAMNTTNKNLRDVSWTLVDHNSWIMSKNRSKLTKTWWINMTVCLPDLDLDWRGWKRSRRNLTSQNMTKIKSGIVSEWSKIKLTKHTEKVLKKCRKMK